MSGSRSSACAQVDVYTPYHDPARCFRETLEGRFRVLVRGGWFPRQLLGRCTALCAYLRCALAALSLSRCARVQRWAARRVQAAAA